MNTILNTDPYEAYKWFSENPQDYLDWANKYCSDGFVTVGLIQSITERELWDAAYDEVKITHDCEMDNLNVNLRNPIVVMDGDGDMNYATPYSDQRSDVKPQYTINSVIEYCDYNLRYHRAEASYHLYDDAGEVEASFPYSDVLTFRMLTDEGLDTWGTEDFDWEKHTVKIGSEIQKIYGYKY